MLLCQGDLGFIVAGRKDALCQERKQVGRRRKVEIASETIEAARDAIGHNGRDDGDEKPEGGKRQEEPLLLFVDHDVTYRTFRSFAHTFSDYRVLLVER